MVLVKCDLITDGSCRLSDVIVPPISNIFTVQAHGFIYGGNSKESPLSHCYELPCYDMVNMKTTMLSASPTIETMKDNEEVVADYAVYQGMLTPTGLLQVLPRPVEEYYSPPSVKIVGNAEGRYRAIFLDPVYTLLMYNNVVYNENSTLTVLRAYIRDCMKEKNYTKATEKYHELNVECWRVLESTLKPPKI